MEKEIKKIVIGFENCETVEIPRNVIGRMILSDFETQIKRNATNSIGKIEFVNTVFIEIFTERNTEYHPFYMEDTSFIFDRINRYQDITSINVIYEDDTEELYWVDYNPENDDLGAPNPNQKVVISEFGNLYLVISENKKIEDFVENINDKEEIEYYKDMFDIGVAEKE